MSAQAVEASRVAGDISATMRAVVLAEPNRFEVRSEVPVPQPAAGQAVLNRPGGQAEPARRCSAGHLTN